MQVTILGKRWNLRFCRLHKLDGECDAPQAPGKAIRIQRTLQGEDALRVLLHELLHAGQWQMSEEYVDRLSRDIARILTRLGWSRHDE